MKIIWVISLFYSMLAEASDLAIQVEYANLPQKVQIFKVKGPSKYFVGESRSFDLTDQSWQKYKEAELEKVYDINPIDFKNELNLAFVIENDSSKNYFFVLQSDTKDMDKEFLWECLCLDKKYRLKSKNVWVHKFRITSVNELKKIKLNIIFKKL